MVANQIFRVEAVVGNPGWLSLQKSVKTFTLEHSAAPESKQLEKVIQDVGELLKEFKKLSWIGTLKAFYSNGVVTEKHSDINVISDEGDAFESHLKSLSDLFNKLNKLDQNKCLEVSFEMISISTQ